MAQRSMKPTWIVIALVTAVVVLVILALTMRPSAGPPTTETVIIGGESFTLDLALDDAAREMGLKGRAEIPQHGGMLFVFPDSKVRVQNFWMHETLTDLDILYLDRHGRITSAKRMNAQPPRRPDETEQDYQARMRLTSTSSVYPAQFVIELKAGSIERLKIKPDDKVQLDRARLLAWTR